MFEPDELVESLDPTPAGRATPDPDELPAEVPPRCTAAPLLDPSGGGVLDGGAIRTGGGGGALSGDPLDELGTAEPELDEPELDEPELDDPELLEGSDGVPLLPRGTACAQAEAGAASVKVESKQSAKRVDLDIKCPPGSGLARFNDDSATLLPEAPRVNSRHSWGLAFRCPLTLPSRTDGHTMRRHVPVSRDHRACRSPSG